MLLGAAAAGAIALQPVAFAQSAPSASRGGGDPQASASAGKCSSEAAGPEIKNLTMFSKGVFRCTAANRNVHATVVLEVREKGRWSDFATVRRTFDMKAGRKYVLRTRSYHCSSEAHYTQVRTLAELVVSGEPIPVRNDGWRVFCIGPSS